jgi:hypothetical protein
MGRGERLHRMRGVGLPVDVADRANGREYRTMEREPVWMGSLRCRGVTFGLLFGLVAASCTAMLGRRLRRPLPGSMPNAWGSCS